MRLLLLEDDPILGDGLAAFLRSEGHVVEWYSHLAQVHGLEDEPYDALLVDWALPDGSGLAWVAAQRRRGKHTPVIVLTARDLLQDRIQGLDAGADDYLVKPFAPEELAARIRAVGRRLAGSAGPRRSLGEVEVDLTAKSVWRQGERVELTAREWAVMEALLLRCGRIVAKQDLEALVHGFQGETASNALEVHVSHLRRKLGRTLIETVRGLGYRLGDGEGAQP
jgi:two-component system OmpR family response regulator